MVFSWIKSIITLQENYTIRADPERRREGGGIGFPGHDFQSYLIFVIVRFLVFGGLYKMVQAGLRERWAWKYRRPNPNPNPDPQNNRGRGRRRSVVRAHRSLPRRFQRLRAAGGGWFGWTTGGKEEVDEMATKRGRSRWWGVYRTKQWNISSRMLLELEAAEIEAERKAAEEANADTKHQVAGEEIELQVLEADKPDAELEGREAKPDAEPGLDKELEGLEVVEVVEVVEDDTKTQDISLDSKEGRQAYWDKKGRENW
ncbi:hypothetical protein GE09DRAFT_274613 [Coniochaeta sp. 2T2.1]|nr:hypothetical protein GE09DRAFT_274613 [Coniochaeta sp. 2T2.1]